MEGSGADLREPAAHIIPGAGSFRESRPAPWVRRGWEGERSGLGARTRSREERVWGRFERLRA